MKFVVKKNRKMNITHVKNAILETIVDCNLHDKLIVDRIKNEWSNIVGVLLAIHSKPEYIRNNVLFVSVDNSMYSNEIIMYKNLILSKLSTLSEIMKINDIRTKIGNIRR